MELERIKALEQYEAREIQRNEERKRGAKILEEQIAQREFERIQKVRGGGVGWGVVGWGGVVWGGVGCFVWCLVVRPGPNG